MLPLLWVAAAALLSGAQAAVPQIVPRQASLNGTTTAETTVSTPVSLTTETTATTSAETTVSTSAETTVDTTETTVNTPGFTTSTSLTSFSETTSSGDSTPIVTTSLPTDTTATDTTATDTTATDTTATDTTATDTTATDTTATDTTATDTTATDTTAAVTIPSSTLTFGSDGGITISGVITIPSVSLPTSFQPTGTGAFVGLAAAATNAGSSFSDVAAAASAIAANPSPSVEDVQAFQNQAQDNFEQISALQAQLKDIDQSSLNDDDSHKVSKALVGLAALLAWFSTEISAVAPVLATPALASSVFADLAPAFAAAAAGGLLADALDDIEDLDDDDDDNNNSTTAEGSTTATSTETSTTTSATSSCSAIPYDLDLVVDDDGTGDDLKRSVAGGFEMDGFQFFEKRALRAPNFANCNPANIPTFPNNPKVGALEAAENPKFQNSPSNKLFNMWVLKWYDRVVDCNDLSPGWVKTTAAEAKAKGPISRFNVDHIWELKFLSLYFQSFLPGGSSSSPKITCDEFNNIFIPGGNDCPLKSLINAVPSSETHPEFMAMRTNLNEMKGRMLKSGELKFPKFVQRFSTETSKTILALGDMGIVFSIFNDGDTINRFDTTNQRIYDLLKATDDRIQKQRIALGNPDFRFAATYQDFMISQMNQAADDAWEFVQTWTATVETALSGMDPEDEETKKLQANYDAYKASGYASQSFYTFGVRTDLAGSSTKRDIWERDDSCPFNSPSSTLTTTESTTDSLTSTTDLTSASTTGETTGTTDQSTTTGDENTTTESTATTEQTTTPGLSTATTEQSTTLLSTTTTEETTTALSTTTTEQTTTPGISTTTTDQTTSETATSTTSEQTSSVFSTPTTFSTAILSSQSTSEETTVTSIATTSEVPSSTHSGLNAQTVTANGMVCVLIEGSVDPVCHPLETPTPNPDGTNVHVNSGCILINGSPRCASDAGSISNVYQSFYNVASDPDQPYSTTLILSGFNSSIDNYLHAYATCELQARWPANYGDIYFGADGCLYDSDSNKIYDQCCGTPDPNNSGITTNPYVAPAPADSSQSSGNHHGSSICASISKDTCLAAAARYVDDIVYHQYTSAVWPDSSGADIANEIFPIAGPAIEEFFGINYGCTVIWTCDDDDAFSQGMTGKQIKDSMLNIYNLDGAKGCGSTYLENRCHITVNGCNNCRDEGRDATIWNPYDVYDGSYGDANDGFPPSS